MYLFISFLDNILNMAEDHLVKNLQAMSVAREDVNILLLGETGVGKSTFINSFANYLEHDKFANAEEKDQVQCLIPAKFTVTNEAYEEKIVQIGKDDNENDTMTQSATLETRSYVFPINKNGIKRVRLIDTPGIGDTRGIDQDNENMENVLSYISNMEYLHAICFLLKPNNTRLTVMFHYCIKQLLSRLEKSASKNIIFLFTNTRSTFYKPGDTTGALKEVLHGIKSKPPFVDIKFGKDNVFCLDNESFRYLVAIKNGIQLGNKTSFMESWDHSVKECWRMLNYITGKGGSRVTPHKVKDTMSVNDARRVILQLSQPIADIADLINDNINVLEKHNRAIQADTMSIDDLKKNLYVPVINLRCKELTQPTTVCTATCCVEIYTINAIKKYHYKQRCHDPCYLQNVPREHIGSPELVNCWAMTNHKCRICKCNFTTHMHIYYTSETYDDRINDEGVKAQIKNTETALNEKRKHVAKLESRKASYEKEKDTIIKTMAKFAYFLQRNAIAPYNDSYKAYLEYLIDREKSHGDDCDLEMIKYYNDLLKRYSEEKQILERALSSDSSAAGVTATTVLDSVKELYNLPHTGSKIRQLHAHMQKTQGTEHKNTEYVLHEANQQVRQKKQNKQQNQQKKQNNNFKQKQNDRGRQGLNQNNQPHMKAKDRRQENFRGQNRNPQNNTPWRQNLPDLRYINAGYFPNQNNYPQHMQNQNFSPNQQFPQNPTFQGPYPNFQGPYQNNPHMMSGPPPFGNFGQNPGHFSNYPTQPESVQNQVSTGASMSYSEFMRKEFSNNTKQEKNASNSGKDANFDEWYANILGGNSNESTNKPDNRGRFRRYNNLSKQEESDDSSSDNSIDSNQSPDADDDDDFKDFMKKNNLEYLVKNSPNNPRPVNENTSTKKKNNSKPYNARNSRRDDSDSDDISRNNQSRKKGFIGSILDKMF
ncbi:50s ribosome-binding gtpase [Holotrichia oblita]|uniref:50s ribosome-binding gtpase n=1 Tax=Holotrichia oblita TaxID=644536 RepID=A0ACB9T346_HOLOL|nr:50s ribosome-binding gtpase [Holotrichia oblita]